VKRSELFARLVTRLPKIVFAEYGRKDVCIPAAYHCQEVLRAQGIPARLASMNVIAMNWPFVEWVSRRADGYYDPMPHYAWSVGITNQNPDMDGYLSHLVCISKGKVLDCASGSMSRPARGMPVPNGLVVSNGKWSDDTTVVTYEPSPEPVPPMWRLDPNATARVRERIEKEILPQGS
jgi:hypothetical protein